MIGWGLAIRLGLVVAAVLVVVWAKTSYDNARRAEGRAECQAAWEADKVARREALAAIILQQIAIRDKLQAELDAAKKVASAQVITVVKELPSALGPVGDLPLPARAVELLNSTDSRVSPPGPASDPARVAAETAAAEAQATVADLAERFALNFAAGQECERRVEGWQTWWYSVKGSRNGQVPGSGG